jgi:hypothetical protein
MAQSLYQQAVQRLDILSLVNCDLNFITLKMRSNEHIEQAV